MVCVFPYQNSTDGTLKKKLVPAQLLKAHLNAFHFLRCEGGKESYVKENSFGLRDL